MHFRNIVQHWDDATEAEIDRGLRWYSDAHHVATTIADGDAHLGAGIIAIYSPQQAWHANLLVAATVLHNRAGLGGAGSGVFASAQQKRAADRVLAGEHYEQVLSGPKIRAFAHLIEHGGNQTLDHSYVVIDRHALSVAHGSTLTVDQYGSAPFRGVRHRDGSVHHRHYDHVVELYHHTAAHISRRHHQPVAAHQAQAVTWLVRQRLTQTAACARGLSALDKGRERARINTETAWRRYCATNLPQLDDVPDTGYQHVA